MKILLSILALSAGTFGSGIAYSSEDPNAYAPLEMTTVTIRLIGGLPYGELYTCPEGCALRRLPLTPEARIYIEGLLTTPRELKDGQKLTGTVFLKSQPIDSIDQIVGK